MLVDFYRKIEQTAKALHFKFEPYEILFLFFLTYKNIKYSKIPNLEI